MESILIDGVIHDLSEWWNFIDLQREKTIYCASYICRERANKLVHINQILTTKLAMGGDPPLKGVDTVAWVKTDRTFIPGYDFCF